MKLIICENYEEASAEAAKVMLEIIKNKPNANLGLATGSTPVKMYELMVEDHEKNGTSYKDIKSYNLDEYYGLEHTHPHIYFQKLILNLKMCTYQKDQVIFKQVVMNIINFWQKM